MAGGPGGIGGGGGDIGGVSGPDGGGGVGGGPADYPASSLREDAAKKRKKLLEEQKAAKKEADALKKTKEAAKVAEVRKGRSLLTGYTKPNVSPRSLQRGSVQKKSLFGDESSSQIY